VLLSQNVGFVLVDLGLFVGRQIGNTFRFFQCAPSGIPPLAASEVFRFGEVFRNGFVAHRLFRGGS
jgi:hypothetical protein